LKEGYRRDLSENVKNLIYEKMTLFSVAVTLRKNTDISRLKPSLACKIFDTITPILSYNCEIWGAYQKQDFKTWDSSPIETRNSREFSGGAESVSFLSLGCYE